MLEKLTNPKDIKKLSLDEIKIICQDIRKKILTTVSKNGGHLASNLGLVEVTVAIHNVFDLPEDRLIYDVSHQCYAHKLLTGRYDSFDTLRQYKGISGFTNPEESEYDSFYAGHAGSSISTALGVATANALAHNDKWTVCVVGDGALTNGMIFEALNNCMDYNLKLCIVLNDNEMSISKNVGGLEEHLSNIRTSTWYYDLKRKLGKTLRNSPIAAEELYGFFQGSKNGFKRLLIKDNIFETLGIDYIGPVDGHDFKAVCSALNEAKEKNMISIVHVNTKKGKGYDLAENTPENYHSTGSFDIQKGIVPSYKESFTSKFSEILLKEGEKNDKLCVITAAMSEGTGTCEFGKKYPDRFFDVAIAEEHMIAFGAGLAKQGYLPVCALYSTFSQRVYDQIFHDVVIQKLPMIIALDHCGIVSGDGITHQGIYDYALFSTLNNTKIYAPETYDELSESFEKSKKNTGVSILRYPKGKEMTKYTNLSFIKKDGLSYTDTIEDADTLVITYGKLCKNVCEAVESIDKNIGIVKYVQIYPIDLSVISSYIEKAKTILLFEESIYSGGFAQKMVSEIALKYPGKKLYATGILNTVTHGDDEHLFANSNLSAEKIKEQILGVIE
ncbi:MAG: 1-deoxy-D-xylulose-5-phosphate synthase [Holdemanella sp.]|nr:1-deoxy-D-xylulose-5-phosphate synthase [Holdemanella sp.]